MVYSNNFVVVVKCNGRILREKDDFVTLPFGSEYSLLIKNLNSRRVAVEISIDGTDVLDNRSLILGANEESELVTPGSQKFKEKAQEQQKHLLSEKCQVVLV